MHPAHSSSPAIRADIRLRHKRLQSVCREFLLAEQPSEEAPVILVWCEIHDECACKLGFGELHFLVSTISVANLGGTGMGMPVSIGKASALNSY
jgi:hypothetical protein